MDVTTEDMPVAFYVFARRRAQELCSNTAAVVRPSPKSLLAAHWLCVSRWPLGRRLASQGVRDHNFLSWCVPDVQSKLAMKDSCRCWQSDQGGMVRNRAVTSGLWSVRRRKCASMCTCTWDANNVVYVMVACKVKRRGHQLWKRCSHDKS
jgi:hypothetical protein